MSLCLWEWVSGSVITHHADIWVHKEVWFKFLVTDCDFPSISCGGAGTSVAVITALHCAVTPQPPIFITFRGALCVRVPGILQLRTWRRVESGVCIQANKMQSSPAMLTCKYSEMQIQWAHCAVYALIACLFGFGANVSLTEERTVFNKGQGKSNFAAEMARSADILLMALTRESCLELWGAGSHLLLWLGTHNCCFSMCNVLWEKIIICPGGLGHNLD